MLRNIRCICILLRRVFRLLYIGYGHVNRLFLLLKLDLHLEDRFASPCMYCTRSCETPLGYDIVVYFRDTLSFLFLCYCLLRCILICNDILEILGRYCELHAKKVTFERLLSLYWSRETLSSHREMYYHSALIVQFSLSKTLNSISLCE